VKLLQKTNYAFLLLLLLTACDNKQGTLQQTEKDSISHTSIQPVDTVKQRYNLLISNIPIPFEILQRLSNSYVAYKPAFMNPVNGMSRYNQSNSKSLNLGVYGADLTYVISMGEFKEFASYIRTIKKLADELGVPTAFDEKTMDRYDQNKNNKDTIENIMYHSYNEIDRSLKSEDRIGMAALVVSGGWIESLYLTTETIGTNDNNGSYTELYNLLQEQKKHLTNLINLLSDFKTEPFQSMVADLIKIRKLYTAAADANHLSQEEVRSISEEVLRLRTKITNGS
jgi:hypothetical protein